MVERAFEYVWVEGKDPNLSWPAFCQYLGLAAETPKPDSPELKAQLTANTELARADGAFGVPTLVINGHAFWGVDTINWALDYLDRPGMFEEEGYQYAGQVSSGL